MSAENITPDELAKLLQDKKRLDWLRRQTGGRFVCLPEYGWLRLYRAEIDRAMKADKDAR